jgi:hypothetical protein
MAARGGLALLAMAYTNDDRSRFVEECGVATGSVAEYEEEVGLL